MVIDKLAKFVTKKAGLTVLMVLAITALMFAINLDPGAFGLEKYDKEDEESFLPDNDVANANKEIDDDYGIKIYYLNIIIKGQDGNVLSKAALLDVLAVEEQIAADPKVQDVLYPQQPNIMTLPSSLGRSMLDNDHASYAEMRDAINGSSQEELDNILKDAGPDLGMFLTKDFSKNLENDVVKAEGGMMLIRLNSEKYDEIEEGGDNPILDADHAIMDIIENEEFEGVSYMGIFEEEYMNEQIEEETGGVMGMLFGLVLIIIIVILFLTYRSVFDTVISLLALIFAVIWMDGIGIILGLSFTAMYDAVPILLLGLGIDYAIHIVMRYREERDHYKKSISDSLVITTVSVGAALFLATLTTGISFGSNTVSEIKPMREFAIFALVGIAAAFFIMVTFIPASKMLYHGKLVPFVRKNIFKPYLPFLLKEEKTEKDTQGTIENNGVKKRTSSDSPLGKFLAKGAIAAEHHAIPVIVGVVVLSLICGAISTQLKTEFDFTEFLPDDAQITEDIVYLTENFEFGTEEADILVKGQIDDPEVLEALAKTEANILDDSHVNEQDPIESILVLMKGVASGEGDYDYNGSFAAIYNDSDINGDGVPDRNITEMFDFLRQSEDYQSNTLRVLHYDEGAGKYDGTVIRVAVNSQNGAKSKDIYDDINDDLKPLEDEKKTKPTATGGPVLTHVIIESIEKSGIDSLIITVFVAGIILTLVFWWTDKSWALGIITEIPVILVIAWAFASMYFLGISFNVMTIMISSLTVGLGITYGIHVTHRFVEDLSEMDNIDDACRSTVTNTGAALFGAAITTVGGFGILIFSPSPPLQKFGGIGALAIVFSLISSVFVLPTFLSVWAKYVKEKDPGYFKHHADVKHKVEEAALSGPAPRETPEEKPVGEKIEEQKTPAEEPKPEAPATPAEEPKPEAPATPAEEPKPDQPLAEALKEELTTSAPEAETPASPEEKQS